MHKSIVKLPGRRILGTKCIYFLTALTDIKASKYKKAPLK
jgi:hypothetical protein